MKILFYGQNGWIGNQFKSLFTDKNLIELIPGTSRIDNEKEVESEILKINPERVISFTGRTYGKECSTIDYLEQPGKLLDNTRDNLYGPVTLALICNKLNIHLTYLGTGCIFNNNTFFHFDEEAKPNFFGSSYSIIKGFTDRFMHQFANVLNVRIRMPITDDIHSRNFITKIVNYDKICSITNSMSVLPTLLPILKDLILKKTTGTINLTNPGGISHNEILELYKEIVDPTFHWKNFTIEDQNRILLSQRSNNILSTDKLIKLYPNVLPIKSAVRQCLLSIKKLSQCYTPNNVLITGGCGFIGSNFINYFTETHPNIKIVNIDKINYCSREKNIHTASNYKFYKSDINTTSEVKKILIDNNIDTIIHFAAQTHVDNCFGNSVQFTYDNILGTHNLLEVCREYGNIKRFIHISTDEVYGEVNDEHEGCLENTLPNPTNPYAATKISAEYIAKSYITSFNLPIIITRGNNVYGEYQYPEKIIPKFIDCLYKNQKCPIQGTGKAKRNFIYVLDMVKAIECILFNGHNREIYNIGTQNEFTVMKIAEKLIKILKPGAKLSDWITYIDDRNFNDYRYSIDSTKLKKLGWKETTTFEEGLEKTINWFTSNNTYWD